MSVHMCVQVHTHVCMEVRGGGPGVSQSIIVHVILLRKGVSLNLGQGVGSQQAPVIHLSLPIPHSARVISAMAICFLLGCWDPNSGSYTWTARSFTY